MKNDKKAKYATDREVALQEEQGRLRRLLDQEDLQARKLENLIDEVKSLTQPGQDLDSAFLCLGRLKVSFYSA